MSIQLPVHRVDGNCVVQLGMMMPANHRMRGLREDLMLTAVQLDAICQSLDGHTRYLQHAARHTQACAMSGRIDELRCSANALRRAATNIGE